MVRLVGVDLPKNKRIAYALTYIHGNVYHLHKNLLELQVFLKIKEVMI